MNVNIQSVHFNADEKLLDYVTRKIEKLNTYITFNYWQLLVAVNFIKVNYHLF